MDAPQYPLTHLILPAWWVRAHQTALRTEVQDEGAMAQAVNGRLAPALSAIELVALANALSQLQGMLLAGNKATLELSLSAHLKHAGQASRARRFAYERLLQELAGLRFVAAAGANHWRTLQIFTEESWRITSSQDLILELVPSNLGHDFLLGLADAHIELLRSIKGEPEALGVLGSEAPLSIWRSVWLDLTGLELEIFLRLEQAMQWEHRWLDLDGSYALPISNLFEGIGRNIDFVGRLRQLSRLGRRLLAHGYLVTGWGEHFLAFGDEEPDSLQVVWQASRERRSSDSARQYVLSVAEWNRQNRLQPNAQLMAQMLSHPDAEISVAGALAREILALSAPAESILALWDGGSSLLSPQMLFLEFALRVRARGAWALPEAVLDGVFVGLADPASKQTVGERFMAFCAALVAEPQFVRNVFSTPAATLASNISREHARNICKPTSEPTSTVTAPSRGDVKPHLVPVASRSSSVQSSPASEKSRDIDAEQFASRMRKTAADELARLRAGDPSKYTELKRAFFDSLDDGAKHMMLEVQRHMEPTKFEEQLRVQLVRFMIENPGAWRSTASSSSNKSRQ